MGVPDVVTSVELLVSIWERLPSESREKAYFLLAEEEERREKGKYILIRPPTEAEIPKVVELRDQFFSVIHDISGLLEDEIVGFCLLALTPRQRIRGYMLYEEEPASRYIREIFVSPPHRRHGVMTRLLGFIDDGSRPLHLLVARDNDDAYNAFLQYGFQFDGHGSSDYLSMTKGVAADFS